MGSGVLGINVERDVLVLCNRFNTCISARDACFVFGGRAVQVTYVKTLLSLAFQELLQNVTRTLFVLGVVYIYSVGVYILLSCQRLIVPSSHAKTIELAHCECTDLALDGTFCDRLAQDTFHPVAKVSQYFVQLTCVAIRGMSR